MRKFKINTHFDEMMGALSGGGGGFNLFRARVVSNVAKMRVLK